MLQLIRPLADASNPVAQATLGDMYHDGNGVTQDEKEAVKWWTRAAEKGEAHSQSNLGESYMMGRGVQQNWTEAIKWWRKAAEQNIARAQTALGMALVEGRWVRQDYVEAAKWFSKAAEQGEPLSQAYLAHMYLRGEGGLKPSPVDAYKWILIAGDEAKETTATIKLMLETMLRPTEKQEAIRLAEQWKFDKGLIKKPPAERSNDIGAVYFISEQQLYARCFSTKPDDVALCEAYIAGVIDTLGSGRKSLAEDAKDILLCFEKKISLRQSREAVMKVMTFFKEDNHPPRPNWSAVNNVIAGVLGDVCR